MSEFDAGAAPVAAEGNPAPVDTNISTSDQENSVSTPNPISTQNQRPEEPAKPVTAREALEKAAAKVKEANKTAEAKDTAKPAETKPQSRTEAPKANQPEPMPAQPQPSAANRGDQQTSEQQPQPSKFNAPERFSNDAKAAWEIAPEPVKAEVHRAIRELEQGHQKYRADAEAYGEIRDFADLAKQHGTNVKDALTRYTGLERRLTSSDQNIKAQAIAEVLQYAGVTPQAYASYVSGQPANRVQAQHDATVSALRQEITDLKQQLGGVTSTIRDQQYSSLIADISKFADGHPRFDELAESVAKLITTGMAADLSEAYQMAERLNPGSATPAPVPPANKPEDLQAQTLKGSKSVDGAPTAGSDPGRKGKPSASVRESLKRAMAQVG